jgi:hypothetical protein
MKLTKLQLAFLNRHGIDESEVFDATGMTKSEYKIAMEADNYLVATGVTKCRKSGHVLRNRSGHCVVCNPAYLAFQNRYSDDGDLYVLYSPSKKLIKVGVAECSERRKNSANKQSYGDINDWKLKFSIRVSNSGYAEKLVHDELLGFRKKEYFLKDGKTVLAKEIFSCSVKHAVKIINSILE